MHIYGLSFEKAECYGVVVGDGTPATHIRLRAFGREQYAMQDLPIHHSLVLSPQSLAEDVMAIHQEALDK